MPSIDLMLSRDADIVFRRPASPHPSSDRHARGNAPPPIPFPWKRALPGLVWCLAVTIAFLTMGPGPGGKPASRPRDTGFVDSAQRGWIWIAAPLLTTLGSVALSMPNEWPEGFELPPVIRDPGRPERSRISAMLLCNSLRSLLLLRNTMRYQRRGAIPHQQYGKL